MDRFIFNDDLLIREPDQKAAHTAWPKVAFALIHPQLIQEFVPIDAVANAAKSRSRHWGFVAIGLAVLALCTASAELLYTHPRDGHIPMGGPERLVAAAAALAGVLSVLIGWKGILFAMQKHRWLINRLRTERIRQFHFQSLIANLPEILVTARGAGASSFAERRQQQFARFNLRYANHPDACLTALIDEGDTEPAWLVDRPAETDGLIDDAAQEYLHAYETLRIAHQIDYAGLKLRSDNRIFTDVPLAQLQRFSSFALAGVLALVVIHIGVLIGVWDGAPEWLRSPYLHVIAIWVALLALGIRTVEEGMRPQQEAERYQQYRSALRLAAAAFHQATTLRGKVAAMVAVEDLCFEELRNFMRTHHRARFVL